MWPFKKKEKKYYRIMWSWCPDGATFTDYIKAKDVADAWKRLRKKECNHPIILRKIEVFKNDEL